MRQLVGGPWVRSRLRTVLLIAVALAALSDLGAFVVLVTRDESPGAESPGAESPGPESPGPDEVARSVVQAVADDDCDDLDGLLADDADLPVPVTDCLRGEVGTVGLSGVTVVDTSTDGGASAVTIGLEADGQGARVVVDLGRIDGVWRVTAIRPAEA